MTTESDSECDLKAVIGGKETGSTLRPGDGFGSGVLRLMGSFEAEKEEAGAGAGSGAGSGVESMATENPGTLTAVGTEENCTGVGLWVRLQFRISFLFGVFRFRRR